MPQKTPGPSLTKLVSSCPYLEIALPVLLVAAVLAVLAADRAVANFWTYAGSLDIGEFGCFPDYTGCPPLPADHPAWWSFFFSF